jgi:hypothetical protein
VVNDDGIDCNSAITKHEINCKTASSVANDDEMGHKTAINNHEINYKTAIHDHVIDYNADILAVATHINWSRDGKRASITIDSGAAESVWPQSWVSTWDSEARWSMAHFHCG